MKKLKIKNNNRASVKKGTGVRNRRFEHPDDIGYLYFDEGFQMLFPESYYFKPVYYGNRKKVKS